MAVKSDAWKAKQWYTLIAPDILGKTSIGETIADEPEKLMGRIVETTLGKLTNDMSKHNIKLSLRVHRVGGDTAYTKFVGHQLTQEYMHSLVKRHTSTIDANISVTTKDGYTIRVKPVCFTLKRARANQVKAIRKIMENVIITKAKEMDMPQFIQEVLSGKLSASIYHDVKPIYPPRRVEIRKTEIVSEPAAAS